jgi:hypothetical protein
MGAFVEPNPLRLWLGVRSLYIDEPLRDVIQTEGLFKSSSHRGTGLASPYDEDPIEVSQVNNRGPCVEHGTRHSDMALYSFGRIRRTQSGTKNR